MSYEVLYFRDIEKILKQKGLSKSLNQTLKAVEQDLGNRQHLNALLKLTLEDEGWRDKQNLIILEGRRYAYKGLKKGIALEANLKNVEWLMYGLLRLQVGFDQGKIDGGILLLPIQRSTKSPLGNSVDLVKEEVNALYPTIHLPVAVVLMDLGTPTCIDSGNNTPQGSEPVPSPDNPIPISIEFQSQEVA